MIADDLSRIAMSPTLGSALARAGELARRQGHPEVTLEHMLLSLCEDPDAGLVLASSNIDSARIKAEVTAFLSTVPRRGIPGAGGEPGVSADLRRILEAAAAAARGGRRREINGAIVLAAIVGDGRSAAAQMLQAQGLTFEGAIRALQRGTMPASRGPAPTNTEDILAGARERVLARTGGSRRVPPAASVEDASTAEDAAPEGSSADVEEQAAPSAANTVEAPRKRLPEPSPEPAAEVAVAAKPEPRAPSPAPAPQPPAEAAPPPSAPRPGPPPPPPIPAPQTPSPSRAPPSTSDNAMLASPSPPPAWGAPPAHRLPGMPPAGAPPPMPPPIPPQSGSGPRGPVRVGAAEPPPGPPPGARRPMGIGAADSGPGRLGSLLSDRRGAPGLVLPEHARPAGRPVPKHRAEIGQLVENIPRTMRVAVPALVEVRIAKAEVKALADGLQGGGAAYQHEVTITKAMSVRLRAPDGGFFIETASPETQWIERAMLLSSDDFASWRWHVTPREKGKKRLQLIISARTVGADGLAAETALPDQVVTVRVRTNYGKTVSHWMGWGIAALIGGLLAKFGEGLLDAGMQVVAKLAAG